MTWADVVSVRLAHQVARTHADAPEEPNEAAPPMAVPAGPWEPMGLDNGAVLWRRLIAYPRTVPSRARVTNP